ncbi:hypothetical protein KO525_03715 [Psychrosphaera sp. B3R10]|uniref:hypothetical protein n=1 Tax=unclassified Psychrosphaera TaxID=2641570 RepID=UPI001C09ECFD|nr:MULTISPECIES: hypothetical protein [unclassified Psychrosphaera]MBU2881385.1 hypothetical protein [Psychrosphaera sp. I2R16]MBU2988484.1 hypothetical protein [Psychrosphaera sp. B3R10]
MKFGFIIPVLIFVSYTAMSSTPIKLTESILNSSKPVALAHKIVHKKISASVLESSIKSYGEITNFTCFMSHDSDLFDTVACHITYEQLKNGEVLEFYYFLDEDDWIGTNVTFINKVPKQGCIKSVSKGQGLMKGLNIELDEC